MFIVPIVAAYGAVGAAGFAAVAAGTASFATFATVAGAAMSSLGMLTKNKTLTKIGSIVGLVGGVASIASSASGAASAGASEGAAGAAGAASEEVAKEGVGEALKSEFANSAVGETIGQATGNVAPVGAGASQASNGSLGSLGTFAEAPAGTAGSAMQFDPNSLGVQPQNLMDQVRANWGQSGVGAVQEGFGSAASAGGVSPALVEVGQQIKDSNALNSLLDKLNGAGRWLGDTAKAGAKFIEQNPATAKVAGNILQGGMQMYASNDAMNQQMNLIEQRRRRLNSPVVLGIQTPQLQNFNTGG